MASSEQPAETWEDLDKLAVDKLSLAEDKPGTPAAQKGVSGVNSNNEGRLRESEEAASRSSPQSCSSSSPAQPIIDPAVRDALISPKYRIQVLRFEADVEKFVREGGEKDLTFDANLTGYQRLLCHRVAQYYGLDTSTVDEGEDQGKILARRTHITGMPLVRLADVKLADSRDQRRVETPPRVLVKNRAAADRAARAAAAAANGEASGQANNRTVQEREQDYSKARARIFGMQQNSEAGLGPPDPAHAQMHDGSMRAMNGSRAPNMGPMSGRGRGLLGRGDQGKKAVFRNREQDLQDPDYRRGYNFPRFDPGFGDMTGMQQGMYIRPTYNSEFPELGGMANHGMQGPFSPGSAPHSPAGPPGLMMAGPIPHPEYMHPAMGAGGQFIPIPMQLMQGMPYIMGPGGTPMQAMPPGNSSNQQTPRSQHTSRPASAVPVAVANQTSFKDTHASAEGKGTESTHQSGFLKRCPVLVQSAPSQ
ncbi:hypothetical protein WJX79_003762 [Trebouxia sp. C0005]